MSSGAPASFGELLRLFRRRLNISQEDLEERARVAKDTISALERGKRNYPNATTVARLATALQLDDGERAHFEAAAKRPRAARTRSEFAAVREPPNQTLTNLTTELESIIGREAILKGLHATLAVYRSVTLVGTGGVGKTRMARQAGANLLGDYVDGVWFVDLAAVVDSALIVERIAAAVGTPTSAHIPAIDTLTSFLRDRNVLLIIDNCEHLIAGAAATVESLISSCGMVRVLATSRERLGARGERVFRVPPLSLPPVGEDTVLEQVAQSGAVQLFVERAQAVDLGFSLSAETAGTVAQICRRLEGIPFAIELAASRMDTLGLTDLVQLVENRFNRLRGRYRSAPQRHRTMSALIDWSFQLLSVDEQVLLVRLACFSGHWTADAAGVVCRFGRLESADILELLLSLVEKSLVVMESDSGRARYRLLEATRRFALSKLDISDKNTLEERVAHWVAEFSDQCRESRHTTPRVEWLPPMLDELDNARAALSRILDVGDDIRIAARIIAGYGGYWLEEGLLSEGFRWTMRALEIAEGAADTAAEASLWHTLSWFTNGIHSVDAANEAIARLDLLGDIEGLAGAYLRLSIGYRQLARFREAAAACDRALALFEQAGRTRSIIYATAFSWKGSALVGLGHHAEARQLFADCIALDEALGDGERAAVERLNLAELDFADGQVASALLNIDRSLEVIGGRQTRAEATALLNAAAYRIVLGELSPALEAATAVLKITRRIGAPLSRAFAIQHLATVAALRGDARSAARLVGYVDACLAGEGVAREPTELRTFDILRSSLSERLAAAEQDALIAAGRKLSEREAIELALSNDSG